MTYEPNIFLWANPITGRLVNTETYYSYHGYTVVDNRKQLIYLHVVAIRTHVSLTLDNVCGSHTAIRIVFRDL